MLHSEKLSIYRFNHELPPSLPLAVRSAGVYALTDDSLLEPAMRKWFSEIFWSEEGRGEFVLEKRRIEVAENEVFYLLPGEVHEIRPLSRRWKYHWFTLDHPMSPQWLEAFGFVQRPLPARRCPVELFGTLRDCVGQGTMEGDRQASHHAHALLLAAVEGSLTPLSKAHSSWVEECRRQLDEKFADAQLNVAAMSHGMGVHRSTLFRAFLAAYGMTPSHYLQNLRLHHAMELLKQTDLPVKEVAIQAGLSNANYLGRLITRLSGMSPRRFRTSYRRERMVNS